mgnify:CR=1 FL=1
MRISVGELKQHLNSNLHNLLDQDSYEVSDENAIDMLCTERFDIIAKIIYIKYSNRNLKNNFSEILYLNHIKALNNFVEYDRSGKIGKEEFVKTFTNLIHSVEERGFDKSFILPINQSRIILDAAHRTSIAIVKNVFLKTITLEYNVESFKFDYLFFRKRGMKEIDLDFMALEYCLLKSDTRIVLIWPRAKGKNNEVEQLLREKCKIVYAKRLNLSKNGIYNLVKEAYRHEKWLGNNQNGYIGAASKGDSCYADDSELRIFLIETDSDLIQIKKEIKKLNGFDLSDSSMIMELAKKYLNWDDFTIVTAG